jgi:hypothetical protein
VGVLGGAALPVHGGDASVGGAAGRGGGGGVRRKRSRNVMVSVSRGLESNGTRRQRCNTVDCDGLY